MSVTCMKQGFDGSVECFKCTSVMVCQKPRCKDGGSSEKELSAPDLLKKAAQHMQDRAATYDKPDGERSMGKTVHAFNAITGRDLTEAEGWLLLQVLKDVRLFQRVGYHADSAEDCVAYSALKAEAKAREVGNAAHA